MAGMLSRKQATPKISCVTQYLTQCEIFTLELLPASAEFLEKLSGAPKGSDNWPALATLDFSTHIYKPFSAFMSIQNFD